MWEIKDYFGIFLDLGLKAGSQQEDDRKAHISLGCLGRRSELRNVSVRQEASALGPRENEGVVRSDKLQRIDRIF